MSKFWMLTWPTSGLSAAIARQLEEAGWDGVVLTDTQCLAAELYVEMALVARETERVTLATGVTNPVTRHAAVTAAAISTVQAESSGRAVLGIGRGDSAVAHIGKSPASVDVLERYVQDLQSYLRGESVELDGFPSRLTLLPRADLPKIPVEVSGTGRRVVDLAVRYADGINLALGAYPGRVASNVERIRRRRDELVKGEADFTVSVWVNVACHSDRSTARELVRGSTAVYARFSAMGGRAVPDVPEEDREVFERLGASYDTTMHASSRAPHAGALPDGFVDRFSVTGPPGEVARRLGELIDAGADRLILVPGSREVDTAELTKSVAAISAEVLPALWSSSDDVQSPGCSDAPGRGQKLT